MTTWPDTGATVAARQQFAATLTAGRSNEWSDAFSSIPRHVFVPRFYRQNQEGAWEPVAWAEPGYLKAVYNDEALTTQLDENGIPTSSSSQPSVMLAMLEALDARDGHNAFELGTGTGYNAALLSHRLGDNQVTSVDVDPHLVAAAARHLQAVGFHPTVHAGDGAEGYPGNAPYDRIIATVGLHMIPPRLLDQAAIGAVIIAPLGYGLVRATVTGPGHATGWFLPTPAYFMARRTGPAPPQLDAARKQAPTDTSVPPADLLGRLKFPASVALPGFTSCSWHDNDGELEAAGLWTADGSTAIAHTSGAVRQIGPRRLWDTIEDLAKIFGEEPARDDFLLTITPTRQTVTYADIDGPSWALPTTP
ncbi:methyltransferase domain-containing protein [Streptomyces sp. NPDC002668]|uniref:methyltransferase domain-containing protein n=1 Tax=Streptomyces sp. NPDC002668 TaxID=3154422 RepID=UPI00331A76B9